MAMMPRYPVDGSYYALTCSCSCSASREKRSSLPRSPGLRPGSEAALAAGVETAGDDDPLDFAGAFIDLRHLGVPEQLLHGKIPHVAVAAEQLYGLGRHPHRGFRGEQLH